MDGGANDLVARQATQPPYSLVEEGRKLAGSGTACLRPYLAQSGGFRIESYLLPAFLLSLGALLMQEGNYERGAALNEEAEALFREHGYKGRLQFALNNLGWAVTREPRAGQTVLRRKPRSVQRARRQDDRFGQPGGAGVYIRGRRRSRAGSDAIRGGRGAARNDRSSSIPAFTRSGSMARAVP